MSTNLNYKQVANVNRRTWNVETYEKRAKARQEAMDKGESADDNHGAAALHKKNDNNDDDNDDDNNKQEFRPALKGAAGPEGSDRAFLQARSTGVMQDLEAQVGQTTFVDTSGGGSKKPSDGVVTATGVGWRCKVCDCFLKDSHTYLDHINGRKHQRKLGYSMRVQRSTTDDLKNKLKAMQQKKSTQPKEEEEIDFAARVERKDQALRERQEERRRRRKERKQKAKQQQEQEQEQTEEEEKESTLQPPFNEGKEEVQGGGDNKDEEEEEEEEPQVDPALAAMMGFSGFGSSAKNWAKKN